MIHQKYYFNKTIVQDIKDHVLIKSINKLVQHKNVMDKLELLNIVIVLDANLMANFAKNLLLVNLSTWIFNKMMTKIKFQKRYVLKYLSAEVEMVNNAVIIAKKFMLLVKMA